MQFEKSPVYDEVNKIIYSTISYSTDYQYNFELYIGTDTLRVGRVIDILFDRDYVNNYTPVIICSVLVPMGTFETYILPKKRELRGRLIMSPMQGISNKVDTNRNTYNIEGRAILKEKESFADKYPNENFNQELGDKAGYIKVHFQLLNPLIEKLMVTNAGGTYRVMTSPDFVKAFLLQFSKIIDNEKTYTVEGISMVNDGLNKEIVPNFIIPSNIKLIDVPGYVNAKISGVYPTGFGYFLERNKWFIFPFFNTRQAENTSNGFLTIIRIPKNALPEVKNSFRIQGKNLFILCNDKINIYETAEEQFLKKGNGARWIDAKNMVEGFVETVNETSGKVKQVIDGSKHINELIVSEEKSKINNITGSAKITSNKFRELSKLSERNGSIATVVWSKSCADYLYPGMPVKIISWTNDTVKELYGVLLGSKEMISVINEGMVKEPTYNRQTLLTLFLEKDVAGFKNINT